MITTPLSAMGVGMGMGAYAVGCTCSGFMTSVKPLPSVHSGSETDPAHLGGSAPSWSTAG